MNPLAVIEANIVEFQALGARRIGVFGSFVRGEARDDSDVDIYVEFDDAKRCCDNFFALHERLEKLLGRRVDLVTDKSITESKARLILPTVRYATHAGRNAGSSSTGASFGGIALTGIGPVPTFLFRLLKILGLQPRAVSDPSQHSRSNLVAVVKCENEILKPWLR